MQILQQPLNYAKTHSRFPVVLLVVRARQGWHTADFSAFRLNGSRVSPSVSLFG